MKNNIFKLAIGLIFSTMLFQGSVSFGATCKDLGGTCTPAIGCVNNFASSQASDCTGGACCIPVSYTVPSGQKCSDLGGECVPAGTCYNYVSDKSIDCDSKAVCCIPMTISSLPSAPAPTDPAPSSGSLMEFTNPLKINTLEGLLASLLNSLRGFVAVVAIIVIIIGGIMYITSGGSEKQIETAKKAIGGALIGMAIIFAAPAFLKEILNILGARDMPADVAAAPSILQIAEKVLQFLLSIVGILAIIGLIVGGAFYMTAYGDEEKAKKGKEIIKNSLIGIIVASAALLLIKQLAVLLQ